MNGWQGRFHSRYPVSTFNNRNRIVLTVARLVTVHLFLASEKREPGL